MGLEADLARMNEAELRALLPGVKFKFQTSAAVDRLLGSEAADAKGIDLAGSSVTKIMCSAEPLSDAKRSKIERMWGAKVYDGFGMTDMAALDDE